MARYVYREGKNGKIKPVKVAEVVLRGTPDEATKPFDQVVLDAYRHVEDSGRWTSSFSKALTKRVHEASLANGGNLR